MTDHHPQLPHGPIQEVFPDVFHVTGTMRNEFFGAMWQFSRNMTIVREEGRLTLINSVRLSPAGLAALDKLGKVTNVVRIGDMHGVDDRFYVDRYKATYWAMKGMTAPAGIAKQQTLGEKGAMPFKGATLFTFETTKRPEGIIRLDREGGIMIACDALQNWIAPDEFFDQETVGKMKEMNFFTKGGIGLAWIHGSEPKPDDFRRLKEVKFRHALCGHGVPLRDTAQADYHAAFQKFFQV